MGFYVEVTQKPRQVSTVSIYTCVGCTFGDVPLQFKQLAHQVM